MDKVIFINHRGSTIKVLPLTLYQHEELSSYLKFTYLEETKKQIKGLPLELSKYAWDKAKEKADKVYPGLPEHIDLVFSPLGSLYALKLALIRANPQIENPENLASEILEEPDGLKAVSKVCGYSTGETTTKPKKLPFDEILHALTNEPYTYTPSEIMNLTLDEIACIWTKPDSDERIFTAGDQQRAIANYWANIEKRKLGIWAEDTIWK